MTEDPVRKEILNTLKNDLNSFLFTRLPGNCSIDRANKISEEIFELILAKLKEGSQDAAYYNNLSQLLREGSFDSGRYG